MEVKDKVSKEELKEVAEMISAKKMKIYHIKVRRKERRQRECLI